MEFYVLLNPNVDGDDETAATDFRIVGEAKTGEAPRCPVCGRYTGALPALPPIRVELEKWGREFGDIAFGPGNELLVSKRMMELFEASRFSGLIKVGMVEEVAEVKSHRGPRGSAPEYVCCRAIRGRAAIDDVASGLVRDNAVICPECRLGGTIKRAERIELEPGTWSGEDIFHARGLPGRILVSETMRVMCEQHALLNCCLVRAENFAFDYYPGQP